MSLPLLVSVIASLLIIISLIQPLSRKLNVSPSVLLATIGILLGSGSSYFLFTAPTDALNAIAKVFVYFPVDSGVFLYVFLPLLVFETTLSLDVRRIVGDGDSAAIFLLAVVAVFIATAFIGLALWPLSRDISLTACLLLGAIVATTDPVAVVTIFRDIGAPGRLGRLVEGESLLNDAAAIALFTVLLDFLLGEPFVGVGETALQFLRMFLGGVLVGYGLARLFVALLPLLRDFPLAYVTLSLALPYLVYVLSQDVLNVSGVVGVVTAGVVFNLYGPSRIVPDGFRYLQEIWKQIAFWASSLIFILASILIPKLAVGLTSWHLLLLCVLILAALAARAVVLFGLMPLLYTLRLGERVSTSFKLVILWGGLRGAVTLALALAVTENSLITLEVQRFVAILATGFVLFTLLINGTTLHSLIRWLKLDHLSPFDLAIRHQILGLAVNDVRQTIVKAAETYGIAPSLLRDITKPYEQRAKAAAVENKISDTIADKDRITLGLLALTHQEGQMILDHFRGRTVSMRIIETLLTNVNRLSEAARLQGRSGYSRSARSALEHSFSFRVARFVQHSLHSERWLAAELADRFEILLVTRRLLDELIAFTKTNISALLGARVCEILCDILIQRRVLTTKSLDALRLQYPEYTVKLEQGFLRKIGLRFEEKEYSTLFEQGLIGPELYKNLQKEIQRARTKADKRPSLDLGLQKRDVVMQSPLFSGLSTDDIAHIARVLKPRFVVPGERILRKGQRPDAVFFISSGAVEMMVQGNKIRLGRGDFFGETALLTNSPQEADAIAIGYSHLQLLYASDFQALLKKHPGLKEKVTSLAQGHTVKDPYS